MPTNEALRRRSLLTIDDVAEILALRPKTIRTWIALRKVSVVRVGRTLRFRPEVIDELIEHGEVLASGRRRRANRRAAQAVD